jgi:hypothetical protein
MCSHLGDRAPAKREREVADHAAEQLVKEKEEGKTNTSIVARVAAGGSGLWAPRCSLWRLPGGAARRRRRGLEAAAAPRLADHARLAGGATCLREGVGRTRHARPLPGGGKGARGQVARPHGYSEWLALALALASQAGRQAAAARKGARGGQRRAAQRSLRRAAQRSLRRAAARAARPARQAGRQAGRRGHNCSSGSAGHPESSASRVSAASLIRVSVPQAGRSAGGRGEGESEWREQ